MLKIQKIIIIVLILVPSLVNAADMTLPEKEKYLQAYYTQQDNTAWSVELKGKIILIGADYKNESDVAEKIQNNTNASVRLYNNLGVEAGEVLYIINSNNLITGKITVTSVFSTRTFGYIMLGKGNLQLVSVGDRVVQRIDAGNPKDALAHKAKGDYYQETGETGRAISFYKSALDIDKGNAGAHLSLGYIYLNDDMLEYAYNEFKEAQKQKRRLYDNEDKYHLYKGLAEVRFRQAYYAKLPAGFRVKYIGEGIEYCKEALKIYPDSKEVNYYLGVFYYKNPQPLDVMARDQFLKVITLDQDNIDAYIALAELYDKHNNKAKAVLYAEQALKINPANDRAKFMLKKFK